MGANARIARIEDFDDPAYGPFACEVRRLRSRGPGAGVHAAVRADRSLIPQAIEEALRWDGPVLIASRTPRVETELCGIRLPAGACLSVAAGSANRDPSRFEDPDRFDIFRKKQRHFAFAFGPHMCIGQHLARVEMTRALNAILDHLPSVRLDPDMPAPRIQGTMMRLPKHIHVCFD